MKTECPPGSAWIRLECEEVFDHDLLPRRNTSFVEGILRLKLYETIMLIRIQLRVHNCVCPKNGMIPSFNEILSPWPTYTLATDRIYS